MTKERGINELQVPKSARPRHFIKETKRTRMEKDLRWRCEAAMVLQRRERTPRQLGVGGGGRGQATHTLSGCPLPDCPASSTQVQSPGPGNSSWVLVAVTSCRPGPQSLGPSGDTDLKDPFQGSWRSPPHLHGQGSWCITARWRDPFSMTEVKLMSRSEWRRPPRECTHIRPGWAHSAR